VWNCTVLYLYIQSMDLTANDVREVAKKAFGKYRIRILEYTFPLLSNYMLDHSRTEQNTIDLHSTNPS
jgi:hypothetical protein